MGNVLVVIDMQNDFIDGSLGTLEAKVAVDHVLELISKDYDDYFATLDTHNENYMDTLEGKKLPVMHCIKDSEGWKINEQIKTALDQKNCHYSEKPTFGSIQLAEMITALKPDKITLCGVCTDICVISNALLLRAYNPNTIIEVVKDACAGVTVENHQAALKTMQSCQIDII